MSAYSMLNVVVAMLVYIDETGSVGRGAKRQPLLTLAAALVDESTVQPLTDAMQQVAFDHLGWAPRDLEFHGNEIWNGKGYWADKTPSELIAAYTDAIDILEDLEIEVSYASIHKQRLHDRYGGGADQNAYLLALQFLLEKIDANWTQSLKILIADEAKEYQLGAVEMVGRLQDWGGGQVPGRKLRTVIDSMHFVSSHASPGVQMADLCAYALQRYENRWDTHPDAQQAISAIYTKVMTRVSTWREPWPAK